MSRGNKNIKVDSAHPFIEFDTVYNTYYDKQEKRDRTVIIGRTPLVQGLTDDILMTGDLNTLKTFMQENQDKLNDNEKAYMQARIEASETIDSLRKKAYSDIAEGKQPQGPEPQNQNGYIGFSELRSPGVQSSGNGCWSVAYSMLLKSRGVDLSQENIRCWRPDQTKNPVEKAQQLESARNALIYRMNTDGANTISQNSDLMTQVLPNTEMRTVKVSEPPHEKYFTVDGKKPTEKDFEKIKENYIDQSTRYFVNIVNKAIKEDHSPIAITYHGHYMTITGISPDGTKIRCEDSFGSTAKDRTKYYDVKSVVEDAMTVRELENGEKLPPTGYELTWLHDLKVPEYDKRNEQALDIEEIQNRFISLDEGGNLTVDAPLTVQNASNNGSASEGQLEGKGLEFPVQMDMKELSDALGGKKIVNLINPDGAYQMGQYDTYLPNKVYYGKDPQLQQYRQNSVDSGQNQNNMSVNQNQGQSQPTQTQPNQTQPTANQTQPTGQHQFDPEFISVMISLKDKAQFVKDEKMLKNSAEARLKNDFEVLIQQIKKDPYISGAFNSQNLENELNVGFNNDPAGFTLRLVDNISNGLGIQSQLQQPGMSQPTANQTNQTQTTNLNQTTTQTQPNTSSTTATQPNTSSTTTANSTANKNFQRINIYDVNNQIEHRWHFMRDNINKAGVLSAIGRKNMIAEIVALSEIGARKRAKGIQNPTASPEEIADFTKQVKKNAAFNRLISNGNDLNIIKSQDTQKLLNGLVRSIWDIEDEKRYDISDKKSLVQKRCKFLANKLEATSANSGKKRTRKEDDYANALNAVKELADKDNPNPHDVKTAVDTVKRYLADKMTQRSNTLDRERWGHFMLFLKETMPRKDFEKYCQEINKARGVAEKTNSKKYVSPEMFGYKKEPVESMLAETRHRIQSGKGTERDYAFAIAIRNRFDMVGFLDNGKTLENDADRQRIIKDTEKVLKSENFRRFMTEIPEETRRTMLNGDADGLYKFQEMLEPAPQRTNSSHQRTNSSSSIQNTVNNTNSSPQNNTNNKNSIRRTNTQRSSSSSLSK